MDVFLGLGLPVYCKSYVEMHDVLENSQPCLFCFNFSCYSCLPGWLAFPLLTCVIFYFPNTADHPKALNKAIRLGLLFMKPIPLALIQCTISDGLIRFYNAVVVYYFPLDHF